VLWGKQNVVPPFHPAPVDLFHNADGSEMWGKMRDAGCREKLRKARKARMGIQDWDGWRRAAEGY
ncbi:MAG: hypothetical protein QGH15_12925, partial [Kiritimatiellia bacterium]|nr:hypothetical protein [Kiritimatiellia bacterium]